MQTLLSRFGVFTDLLIKIEQVLLQAVKIGPLLRIGWKAPKVVHACRDFKGDGETLPPQAFIGSGVGKRENPFQLLVAHAFQLATDSKGDPGFTG